MFGETDAVTEPLTISVVKRASSVSAERGISNKPAPLPVNIDADTLPSTLSNPFISTLPVNCEPLLADVTTNPSFGATIAVTAPLTISLTTISVNSAPLPLKVDADTNVPAVIEVVVFTEPINCEPIASEVTTNPPKGLTEAVTEPLAI